jgi:hypothetical protein
MLANRFRKANAVLADVGAQRTVGLVEVVERPVVHHVRKVGGGHLGSTATSETGTNAMTVPAPS